jgi:hypothetical protein
MTRFILITVAGAVLGALVGPRGPLGGFWAPGPHAPQVDGALRAGFAAWNVVECLAFGAGLAVLLVGRTWFVRRTASAGGATAAWLAACWLLVSWLPHAALHQHVGMQPGALLAIEWVFHGGAILAIGILLLSTAGPAPGSVEDGRQVGALGRGVEAGGHERHRLHDA